MVLYILMLSVKWKDITKLEWVALVPQELNYFQ